MSATASHPYEQDFDHFFEKALCGFLTISPSGQILRANSRMAQWTGLTTDELKSRRFSDLLTIGGKVLYETHLSPLLRMQDHFDEVAVELSTSDGQRIPVFINAYECSDESGAPLFVRMTIYKASERHAYEQNLREAKTNAEADLSAEQEKSLLREQFIAVLGHDLRNPLGAITSGSLLLSRSPLNERDKSIVAMMGESSARMLELIENVMDFARSRMGDGMAVDLQPTDMETPLKHVVDELRLAWPQRTINTEFRVPTPVTCDVRRITQLLSNLLANALTHGSKDTPIHVRAKTEDNIFELSVSNGGKPIPPASLERLFQPFTREAVHPSQNGLGLGLYIASEIARAHKSALSATSTADETRFVYQMSL